jgi:hypothetical protein
MRTRDLDSGSQRQVSSGTTHVGQMNPTLPADLVHARQTKEPAHSIGETVGARDPSPLPALPLRPTLPKTSNGKIDVTQLATA